MAGIFTQIRPEWRSELEVRQKTPKINIFFFIGENLFSDVGDSALNLFCYVKKSCFRLLLYTLEKAREDFFNFEFLLCLKVVFVRFQKLFF